MHDSYIRYSAEEKECIVLSVKRSELSIIPHWFGWGISCLDKSKKHQKALYQWINPKNVTSIYKSTSQGIMLRN